MVAPDLYLLASEAPGVLDDWTGPVEWRDPHPRAVWWHGHSDEPDGGYGDIVRIDLRRAEVRDRLVRWGREHDGRWTVAHEPGAQGGCWMLRIAGHPDFGCGADGGKRSKRSREFVESLREHEIRWWWNRLRDDPSALLAEVKAVAATLRG